jgi:hypothetical protein
MKIIGMKAKGRIVGLGMASLLLGASEKSEAATCLERVADERYSCTFAGGASSSFSLDFSGDGRKATFNDLLTMQCFCSSAGTVAKPGLEGGRDVSCVATISEEKVALFSARLQGRVLAQGIVADFDPDGSEALAFLCKRSD